MKPKPPHPKSYHLGETWLEPEELTYPGGGFSRRAVVVIRANEHHSIEGLPVGSTHVVRCSVPYTYFTIPARLRLGRHQHGDRTIRGYVSEVDGFFAFTPEADPALCRVCEEGEGCKKT